MGMASATVDKHENGLYLCGYSWEWSLLLWLLMGMASATVDTHGNSIYYCGLSWE